MSGINAGEVSCRILFVLTLTFRIAGILWLLQLISAKPYQRVKHSASKTNWFFYYTIILCDTVYLGTI